MEIYLHTPGREDPEIVEVDATATFGDFAVAAEDEESELVWLDDQDEPLASEQSLEAAGVAENAHLHRNHCHRIDVRVRYGGRDYSEWFSPAARIKRVFNWATGPVAFKLTPEEKIKHVLALPNADHFLAPTVHIGSVAEPGTCSAVLELAPRERFEG